ncbi:hypothetical protein BRC86_08730 [Halobacteriales archaeon QS_3_64_16]|nr:MAG: hypothetical protein BRC86_08730 [Halobacteriales archaeon QS_3_64_16]
MGRPAGRKRLAHKPIYAPRDKNTPVVGRLLATTIALDRSASVGSDRSARNRKTSGRATNLGRPCS